MLKNNAVILTENFTSTIIATKGDSTHMKWLEKMELSGKVVCKDWRTDILCVDPTMDYLMYYNYLKLLNSLYEHWVNYGLLDAGYTPYILLPKFNGINPLRDALLKISNVLFSLDLRKEKGCPFIKKLYVSNITDYWVKREQLLKAMKEVNLADEIPYMYDTSSVLNATMTNFLEPMIKQQEI